ncbi:speedy protein A [Stigmatopora argus]
MMKPTKQMICTSPTFGVSPRGTPIKWRRVVLKRIRNYQYQEEQGPPKSRSTIETRIQTTSLPKLIFIQQEEMTSYLKLFDDGLIHKFLLMDICCKMTDKYLLAMVFIYFKRSHLTIAEYTRKNFFIALHLANTMEEDEDSKCEIFPWALGKTWRRKFRQFLKQRDQLWARIDFRAAVSRSYCEQVMAITPTHFAWKRERSEQHSGAHRRYEERNRFRLPRGPTASPVACAHCNSKGEFKQQTVFFQVPPSLPLHSYNFARPRITRKNMKKTPLGTSETRWRWGSYTSDQPFSAHVCHLGTASSKSSMLDYTTEE